MEAVVEEEVGAALVEEVALEEEVGAAVEKEVEGHPSPSPIPQNLVAIFLLGCSFSGIELHYEVKIAQLCPTLCYPMDYRVHGILHARIHGTFSFSRVSCEPRYLNKVSHIADGFFTS